jgi:hypothetical protein
MAITATALTKSKGDGSPYTTPSQTTPSSMKHLVVLLITEDDGAAPAFAGLTDNKSNTLTLRLAISLGSGNKQLRVFSCKNATGGSGHTFSVASTGGNIPCSVLPLYLDSSNDIDFDQQNTGDTGFAGSPFASSSITVAASAVAFLLAVHSNTSTGGAQTYSYTNSFTTVDSYNDGSISFPVYNGLIGVTAGSAVTVGGTPTAYSTAITVTEGGSGIAPFVATGLLSFVESAGSGGSFTSTSTDTTDITDVVSVSVRRHRALEELTKAVDDVSSSIVSTITRNIFETVAVQDEPFGSVRRTSFLSDSITYSVEDHPYRDTASSFEDVLVSQDILSQYTVRGVTASETVSVDDAIFRVAARTAFVSDETSVQDDLKSLARYVRNVLDVSSVIDEVLGGALTRYIEESINIVDALSMITTGGILYTVVIDEGVTVLDERTGSVVFYRELGETLQCDDLVTSLSVGPRLLDDGTVVMDVLSVTVYPYVSSLPRCNPVIKVDTTYISIGVE